MLASFPQGILWGFLGCTAAFGISLVVERSRGTLIRLYMAPISRGQVLAGKGLACFITTVLMATLLMGIGRLVFDVRPTSIPLLALAICSCALCFVGIMMLLSVLGRTEAAAGGIGWSVLLVLSMFGGGMVGPQLAAFQQQLGPILNNLVNWDVYSPEPTMQFPGVVAFLEKYRELAPREQADLLGNYIPPYAYAQMQVLEQLF